MARPGRIFGREPRAEELPVFSVTGAGRQRGRSWGHSGSAYLGAATPEPAKLPLTPSCRASAACLGVGAVLGSAASLLRVMLQMAMNQPSAALQTGLGLH